jgi:hypothetical protein
MLFPMYFTQLLESNLRNYSNQTEHLCIIKSLTRNGAFYKILRSSTSFDAINSYIISLFLSGESS